MSGCPSSASQTIVVTQQNTRYRAFIMIRVYLDRCIASGSVPTLTLSVAKATRLQAAVSSLEKEREQKQLAEKKLVDIQLQKRSASQGACWQYEMDGY